MLLRIADVLDHLRDSLPPTFADYVPQSVSELRARLVEMLKEHGRQVSTLGIDGLRASAMALVGLILGAMVAWSEAPDPAGSKPLSAALLRRLGRLETAFEAVVFAQVKISALNTVLAVIYLMGVLPALGLHVPYSKSLVLLTFVAGLIPVAGNLISNTAIVLMSVAVSLELALASLAFLVIVHKLEYFVNARIIGSRIDARAWELILALIVMEALFGVGGVIAAPVLYAYLEARAVGRRADRLTAGGQVRPPARLRWRCRQKRARPTGRWARNNSLTERRQRAEGRYAGCGAWGGGRVASRAVSAASAITKQPVMRPASGAWWTWSPIARRIVPGDTTCMLPSADWPACASVARVAGSGCGSARVARSMRASFPSARLHRAMACAAIHAAEYRKRLLTDPCSERTSPADEND